MRKIKRKHYFKNGFVQVTVAIFIAFIFGCSSQVAEDYHIVMGSLAEKFKWHKIAISQYEKAIALNPRNVPLYLSVGHIYQYELNDKNKAIEVYNRGLSYAPTDYGMNLNIMYAYFDISDFEKAIKKYVVLSKIDEKPFHAFPRDALDEILLNMNEEEVINFCKKYLSVNPGDIILRDKLLKIYMGRKDYKKAKAEFNARLKYSRKLENIGPIYFGLAVCDYYTGQYQSSLDYLLKAKELGEHVPEQYFEMVREKMKK